MSQFIDLCTPTPLPRIRERPRRKTYKDRDRPSKVDGYDHSHQRRDYSSDDRSASDKENSPDELTETVRRSLMKRGMLTHVRRRRRGLLHRAVRTPASVTPAVLSTQKRITFNRKRGSKALKKKTLRFEGDGKISSETEAKKHRRRESMDRRVLRNGKVIYLDPRVSVDTSDDDDSIDEGISKVSSDASIARGRRDSERTASEMVGRMTRLSLMSEEVEHFRDDTQEPTVDLGSPVTRHCYRKRLRRRSHDESRQSHGYSESLSDRDIVIGSCSRSKKSYFESNHSFEKLLVKPSSDGSGCLIYSSRWKGSRTVTKLLPMFACDGFSEELSLENARREVAIHRAVQRECPQCTVALLHYEERVKPPVLQKVRRSRRKARQSRASGLSGSFSSTLTDTVKRKKYGRRRRKKRLAKRLRYHQRMESLKKRREDSDEDDEYQDGSEEDSEDDNSDSGSESSNSNSDSSSEESSSVESSDSSDDSSGIDHSLDYLAIVMERMDGCLKDFVRELTVDETLSFLKIGFDFLSHLRRMNLIHNDLKAENIFVSMPNLSELSSSDSILSLDTTLAQCPRFVFGDFGCSCYTTEEFPFGNICGTLTMWDQTSLGRAYGKEKGFNDANELYALIGCALDGFLGFSLIEMLISKEYDSFDSLPWPKYTSVLRKYRRKMCANNGELIVNEIDDRVNDERIGESVKTRNTKRKFSVLCQIFGDLALPRSHRASLAELRELVDSVL